MLNVSLTYLRGLEVAELKEKPLRKEGACWWSHLGSNQGPTDYESATLTN